MNCIGPTARSYTVSPSSRPPSVSRISAAPTPFSAIPRIGGADVPSAYNCEPPNCAVSTQPGRSVPEPAHWQSYLRSVTPSPHLWGPNPEADRRALPSRLTAPTAPIRTGGGGAPGAVATRCPVTPAAASEPNATATMPPARRSAVRARISIVVDGARPGRVRDGRARRLVPSFAVVLSYQVGFDANGDGAQESECLHLWASQPSPLRTRATEDSFDEAANSNDPAVAQGRDWAVSVHSGQPLVSALRAPVVLTERGHPGAGGPARTHRRSRVFALVTAWDRRRGDGLDVVCAADRRGVVHRSEHLAAGRDRPGRHRAAWRAQQHLAEVLGVGVTGRQRRQPERRLDQLQRRGVFERPVVDDPARRWSAPGVTARGRPVEPGQLRAYDRAMSAPIAKPAAASQSTVGRTRHHMGEPPYLV
jgi:hypothetical protein